MKPEETLLYDLSNRPASFDFVTCCAIAMTCGTKHVRFVYGQWKQKNYTIEQAEERFKSIVEPAVSLWGMDYTIGKREGTEYPHMLRNAIETYKIFGRLNKIEYPVKPRGYITITLRNSRNPERNSKDDEWMRFASRCKTKAIIIRDNEDRPLELGDRMKLYAGAQMNFGVINGTMTLCFHSDAPYICMRTIGCERSGSTSPEFSRGNGITPGFQFPWANAAQRLSYLDDTCSNIEQEWEKMQPERRMAA